MSSSKKRRPKRRSARPEPAATPDVAPPADIAAPADAAPVETAPSAAIESVSHADEPVSPPAAEPALLRPAPIARWRSYWSNASTIAQSNPLAIAIAAAAVVIVVVLTLWRPGAPAPAGEARFVGSDACAACHRAQHDAWQRSPHALAMQRASATSVRARFGGERFRYAGIDSTFTRRDGAFVARTDGPGGKPTDFEIAYTLGVAPLQQYLVELPGGKLQALSIAWDARPKDAGGERWFHLYPLDKINFRDELHWTRRAQNANSGCAACHALDVRKRYDASSNTYRTTWSQPGVGCESCHGPGSLHVAAAQAKHANASNALTVALDERRGARWTIDPSTGNATRSRDRASDTEIEVCAPCHSRRTPIAEGWQAGRRFLDFFRPALIERGLYHVDGSPRDEVYEWGSFVQSRAYRRGVTCGDCHEPHGGGLRAQGNALCAQCHAAPKYAAPSHHHHAQGPGARCVDCHMPASNHMVIAVRHDHSLRVPRPDLSVALGTPNACNGCHRDKSGQWADEHIRGWYGHRPEGLQRYAPAFAYAERGAAEAGRNLVTVARDVSQPPLARASALKALASFGSPAASDAAKRAASDADPLVRDASIAVLANVPPTERWPALAPLLSDPLRTIRVDAAAALADSPNATGDAAFARAAAEYETTLRYRADRPEARVALGSFYAAIKRPGDADAAFREALALDPSYAPAYVAFGDAFRAQDRDADAARVLREGLAHAPDDPSLHHALGLAYVRMKRTGDGLRELARATQLAPSDAHLAYVYAVALNAHGRTPLALREIDRALARHPDDRELLMAAVTFRRDARDAAGAARFARRFVERYPDDPQAQRLANEARGR